MRHFLALLIPAATACGLLMGGAWAWLTVLLVYGLVPLLDELWRGGGSGDGGPVAADRGTADKPRSLAHDLPLYLALPVQCGLLALFATTWSGEEQRWWVRAGWLASTGITAGGLGIVVAHELVHRRSRLEAWLGRLLLMTVFYMHFAIEHVRGHHLRVATDEDPASARLGVSVYSFIPSSILRQFASAARLEAARLRKAGRPVLGVHNEFVWFLVMQAGWAAALAALFGVEAMLACMAVAAIAVALLEVVNYIEHYGLRRAMDARGRLEPVGARHAWNSEHAVGRLLLFELPRHTDHHMNAGRPYQTLRSVAGAPQLPAGYPAMVMLALCPPLWFRVMDARVVALSRA